MTEIAATCLIYACDCGVSLEVESGRVVGARGRPGHPPTRDFICPNGRGWYEIGWEHAPDEAADELGALKAGQEAESVAVYVGEGGLT